jgi:hypothetical protein
MKKVVCYLLCVIITPSICTAQDVGANFGIITKAEADLKECTFDKEANAVVLFDKAVSNYDEERQLITDRHIRIKILNEKGYDNANVAIYFYRKDGFESIRKLEAVITNVNADGSITAEQLPNKSFYEKNENDQLGKMIFTFPNVKVGSIIEYKYQSIMKYYSGLRDWYFQGELPILKSGYSLYMVPNLEFSYVVKKQSDRPVIVNQSNDIGKVYFEMNDVPGLGDEAYMDSREDYLQKVQFQLSGYNRNDGFGKKNYMTTWSEAIKELMGDADFGVQIEKNISGTKDFSEVVKKVGDEKEKMKAVYNYVCTNMGYNGLTGKYARDGVKEAWRKKQGSQGEINLVLINLLKEAGLEVYPMLVSERSNGRVDAAHPFIGQFNTTFAYVIINGKKYYLDATDKYTPVHVIPKSILNTTGLVINKKNGGLITITNDSLQYSDYLNVQMELDKTGRLSGEVYIKNEGYSRIEKLTDYKDVGKEKYIDRNFRKNEITITNFEFINENKDSLPIEEKFKFAANLPNTGDYIYVPLNLFFGFEKNPFTNDNRFSDVNFGYKRKISTYAAVNLPAGFNMDELPKPIKMVTPKKDIEFNRSVTYDKESNAVTCMFVIDFKKSLYTVDEYPVLQEVYKKMFEFLKEPLVLKKN